MQIAHRSLGAVAPSGRRCVGGTSIVLRLSSSLMVCLDHSRRQVTDSQIWSKFSLYEYLTCMDLSRFNMEFSHSFSAWIEHLRKWPYRVNPFFYFPKQNWIKSFVVLTLPHPHPYKRVNAINFSRINIYTPRIRLSSRDTTV